MSKEQLEDPRQATLPECEEFVKQNNGNDTDYYKIPADAEMLQDLIEHKDLNWNIANIFKSCYRINDSTHSSYERDLNKILWFANRELNRINK